MSSENIVATALGDDDEGDAYWDWIRELHKRGTRAVFERAAELCSASDARSRQLGLDILAQLGYEVGRPFLEDVLRIATRLDGDSDAAVRKAALSALAHQVDGRALRTVLRRQFDSGSAITSVPTWNRFKTAVAAPMFARRPPVMNQISIVRAVGGNARPMACANLSLPGPASIKTW